MYGVAIVGQLLMSFVIAVVLKSTGVTGIGGGVLAGFVLWLGSQPAADRADPDLRLSQPAVRRWSTAPYG